MYNIKLKQIIGLAVVSSSALVAHGQAFPYGSSYNFGRISAVAVPMRGYTEVEVFPLAMTTYWWSYKYIGNTSRDCIDIYSTYVSTSTRQKWRGDWDPKLCKYGSQFVYNPAIGVGGQAWVGKGTTYTGCY